MISVAAASISNCLLHELGCIFGTSLPSALVDGPRPEGFLVRREAGLACAGLKPRGSGCESLVVVEIKNAANTTRHNAEGKITSTRNHMTISIIYYAGPFGMI